MKLQAGALDAEGPGAPSAGHQPQRVPTQLLAVSGPRTPSPHPGSLGWSTPSPRARRCSGFCLALTPGQPLTFPTSVSAPVGEGLLLDKSPAFPRVYLPIPRGMLPNPSSCLCSIRPVHPLLVPGPLICCGVSAVLSRNQSPSRRNEA